MSKRLRLTVPHELFTHLNVAVSIVYSDYNIRKDMTKLAQY